MHLFIYNALLWILSPIASWWLARHPRYAPLVARFAPEVPRTARGCIWVHVCSLGEANGARPLVEALQDLDVGPMLVTASTVSGHERAVALYGADQVTWFPFDTRKAVRGFLGAARPRILVLFETELWPNVLSECHRAGIPVLLANGRLSDKHLHRYTRYRRFFRPLIQHIDHACMQESVFQDRIIQLGLPESRVSVTGSLKFDGVRTAVSSRERQRIRQEWGFKERDIVLLFASTRPGDEALASACWATLKEESPHLKLVIAPRHLDRMDDVLEPFSEAVVRRTSMKQRSQGDGARVYVMDTLGELNAFYAVAQVAVIGGSFYPGVNGHNPLEAAALGIPTVFGPYMSNFSFSAQVLRAAGGATQVACPEDLYLALSTLIADPAAQRHMGTAARRTVIANQGAVTRTTAVVRRLLDGNAHVDDTPESVR